MATTKIIEIERRVTASADQYLKFEVSAADWDRYLEMSEGDETEAVYALQDTYLLTFLECEDELVEVFDVHEEQITISDGEERREPPRHPSTPSFLEYPSFDESANFDPTPDVSALETRVDGKESVIDSPLTVYRKGEGV